MTDNPKTIMVAKLEVVVMPNGEIICLGKTIGYVKEFGGRLSDEKPGV